MNRRSFIGSVLGTIASLSIPFRAERAIFTTGSSIDRIKRTVRIFEVPEDKLHNFKCGLILDNDETILVRHTCEVTRDMEALKVQFRFYSIAMTRAIGIKGMVLIDDVDHEVRCRPFTSGISYLTPGDILRVYYDLDVKGMEG